MHPPELYDKAVQLQHDGVPFSHIWRMLNLNKGTVGKWLYGDRARQMAERRPQRSAGRCAGCAADAGLIDRPDRYAYLLGQYLGDGHLVTSAKVPVLRIYCTTEYGAIIEETRTAMLDVLAKSVSIVPRGGCVTVQSYSNHWPCLFPQHGPGMKHQRTIRLVPWQEEIVVAHPRVLLRGLIHSDGCRGINEVKARGKLYQYPRYLFSNESADILGICGEALDRVGAEWRYNRRNSISVAKRDSVALLDTFIGPKS